MVFAFNPFRIMKFLCSLLLVATLCALPLVQGHAAVARVAAQGQNDLSNAQRMTVMKSKLDAMRRSLTSAISAMNAADKGDKKNPDDPRERLRGLDKEVGSILQRSQRPANKGREG